METTNHSILLDLVIQSSKENIYNAVSQPTHLNNWWTLKCTGKPEIGEEYNLHFTPKYDWFGKVVACEPETSFHIKMTKSDEDWNSTTFGFDLEETNHGILVLFRHTGWPHINHHFRKSAYSWALLLNGLKNYVEKGVAIPFEERG